MDDLPLSENDLHAIVRSISKNGDFFLAQGEPAEAARSLSPEQSVRLYEYVRDSADRLEFKWRDEFVEAFPGCQDLLPTKRGSDCTFQGKRLKEVKPGSYYSCFGEVALTAHGPSY